jgi:hypothetical protein
MNNTSIEKTSVSKTLQKKWEDDINNSSSEDEKIVRRARQKERRL